MSFPALYALFDLSFFVSVSLEKFCRLRKSDEPLFHVCCYAASGRLSPESYAPGSALFPHGELFKRISKNENEVVFPLLGDVGNASAFLLWNVGNVGDLMHPYSLTRCNPNQTAIT